jgi:hypothetical protein
VTVSLDSWPKREPPRLTIERDGDNVHATIVTTRSNGQSYTDHVDRFSGVWYCTCRLARCPHIAEVRDYIEKGGT